jgi:hypothetical protein
MLGSRWVETIREKIDTCAAFVVLMTPAGEDSAWVHREIDRAQAQSRPMFPLLMEGREFFRLSDVQYENVTNNKMPSDYWLTRLSATMTDQHHPPPGPAAKPAAVSAPTSPPPAPVPAGGYVFVSYSHRDKVYVDQLVTFLRSHGIEVWTDEGIDYGSRWEHEIESKVEGCRILIPVMSDHSRVAPWVTREIDLAQELNKPILPLLLSGRRFMRLRDLQDEDVTGGRMPSTKFIAALRSQPA